MNKREKLLQEMFEADLSIQDLITDIYAINLAMYMDDNLLNMPDEFIEMGKKLLIERNINSMSDHLYEVWLHNQRISRHLQEQTIDDKSATYMIDSD